MVSAKRVLLVGWDAAEWAVIRPLVNTGLMPNFTRLIEAGVSGNLAAPVPFVSPATWTSIVTGKRAWKHGVLGPSDVRPDGLDTRPATAFGRKTKAVWNILSQSGRRSCVINAPASAPPDAIDGVFVAETAFDFAPADKSTPVHPAELRAELKPLLITPADLGDDLLSFLLPHFEPAEPVADPRVHFCRRVLAHTASVHAVACHLFETQAWDFGAVFYTGLERLSHRFMPFHPPRMSHIKEGEFEFFRHVTHSAYRLHDSLLGRLIELAGADAHVLLVSDHGFVTGSARIGRTSIRNQDDVIALHRPQGVLAISGAGIRVDDTIESASALDVTPTVLQLFDLSVGADMDGRPLSQVFEAPTPARYIASWDASDGSSGSQGREPPVTPDEAIRYLVELGYIERPTTEARQRIERVRRDNAFCFAQSLLDAHRYHEAIPLLRPLVHRHPNHPNYGKSLFEAYLACDLTAEARALVQRAWDRGYRGSLQHVGLAMVDLKERSFSSASEHLDRARAQGDDQPGLSTYIGQAYLRLQKWPEAEQAFAAELSRRPDDAVAWTGRASAALHERRFEDAAEHALRAVGLRAEVAEAHLVLGISLFHLHRYRDAVVALRRNVVLDPHQPAAYRFLARTYEGPLNDSALAMQMRQQAIECRMHRARPAAAFASTPACAPIQAATSN